MVKFITSCIEMETDTKSHIDEQISNKEIPNKKAILEYLKNGEDNGVSCSSVFDFVGGYSTGETIHRYKDDEYEWDGREIYHFEKYNLKLTEDFLNHVVSLKI